MNKHCEKFDACYEEDTGEWSEDKCESKDCEYCSKRPDKHIPHEWEFVDGVIDLCGKSGKNETGDKT